MCLKQAHGYARVAQLVERDLAKVEAAGSSPVSRSTLGSLESLIIQGFWAFFAKGTSFGCPLGVP